MLIRYAMFTNCWHRRILPMLKAFIIILMALLIAYGFFIFGLEYKDQQEIINFINQ